MSFIERLQSPLSEVPLYIESSSLGHLEPINEDSFLHPKHKDISLNTFKDISLNRILFIGPKGVHILGFLTHLISLRYLTSFFIVLFFFAAIHKNNGNY